MSNKFGLFFSYSSTDFDAAEQKVLDDRSAELVENLSKDGKSYMALRITFTNLIISLITVLKSVLK